MTKQENLCHRMCSLQHQFHNLIGQALHCSPNLLVMLRLVDRTFSFHESRFLFNLYFYSFLFPCVCSLTHSLTYSLTHSLTHSLAHSLLTHSLTHSLTHLLTQTRCASAPSARCASCRASTTRRMLLQLTLWR